MRRLPDFIRCVVALAITGVIAYRFLDPPTEAQSWVPWVFLVLLWIGLTVALFRYRQPYEAAANALREDREKIASRLSDAKKVLTQASDGQAPKLEELDMLLKSVNHQSLRTTWKRFLEAWYGSTADDPTIGPLLVNPEEHFTINSILGRHIGTLPNALPGVFTAIGLLGTFVGIAMGLADIVPSESIAASEDLMQGIQTLLGGMSTAFLTSILGITYSVWWLFDFRFAERKCKVNLEKFLDETARGFRIEEPHETLMRVAQSSESFGRSAIEIQKTALGIKGDVQTLGQDLAEALKPYFEKHIGEPIRNLSADLGKRQMETMENIIEVFRETLHTSLMEEFSAFGQSIRETSDHWANATKELEKIFDRLVEVSNAQIKLLARTTEVATVFENGLAALTATTKAVESAGESVHKTMMATHDTVDIARSLSEENRKALEVQEKLSDAAKRSLDAQTSLLEDVKTTFGRLSTDLSDKVTEFQTASAQKIREIFHDFDSEMAKVVNHLGGTLAELREVTEELPNIVGKLHGTIHDLADAGRVHRGTLEKSLQAFEKIITEIVGQFEPVREEIRKLEFSLNKLAEDINLHKSDFTTAAQSTQKVMETMTDALEKGRVRSDNNFKQLVDSIDAAGNRITEKTIKVNGGMEPDGEQTAAMAEGVDRLSQQTEALTKAFANLVESIDREANVSNTLSAHREVPPALTKATRINSANEVERPRDEIPSLIKENKNVEIQHSKIGPTESRTDSDESTVRKEGSLRSSLRRLFGRDR